MSKLASIEIDRERLLAADGLGIAEWELHLCIGLESNQREGQAANGFTDRPSPLLDYQCNNPPSPLLSRPKAMCEGARMRGIPRFRAIGLIMGDWRKMSRYPIP